MKASVVILTYNGAPTIGGCLKKIFAQQVDWPFDVHIIDSGSSDGTLDIIKEYPVQLTQIHKSSFNHGATRNLGAANTVGEFLLFIVQDAEPVGRDWLSTLVEAAEKYDAAGVFGPQIPRGDASLFTKWEMSRTLPNGDRPVIKRLESYDQWSHMSAQERHSLAFFDNVNSCIRRQVLLKFPFRPRPYGEDIDWAKRVLLAGHSLVFEPHAGVFHSHERSSVYAFRRAYSDHSLVKELFDLQMIDSVFRLPKAMAWNFIHFFIWLIGCRAPARIKIVAFTQMFHRIPAHILGSYLGSQYAQKMSNSSHLVKLDEILRRGI